MKDRLSKEEEQILNALEEGKWEMVKPTKAELEHYADEGRAYAS